MAAVVVVVLIKGLHVGRQVDACFLGKVVHVGNLAIDGKVVPPDIRQHHDVRQILAGERSVELLRCFFVVLAGINEVDLDVRVLLFKAGDDLLLNVLGGARVVGPPGQLGDFTVTALVVATLRIGGRGAGTSSECGGRSGRRGQGEEFAA